MTRIAHVTAPAAFGGLERVVSSLCLESVRRGHQVLLVMSVGPNGEIPAWASELGSTGVTLEALALRSRAYFTERRLTRALLQKHQVEIVHTHGFRSDVVQEGVARGLRLPLVTTAHGFASTGGVGKVYEWLQTRAWRRFDAVVAVSNPLMDLLATTGVPEERLVMIRNGLVSSSAAPLPREVARQRLGLDTNVPIVGWVGRFSGEKNPRLAIDVLARTTDRRVQMGMIGGGPELDACRSHASELGVTSRVHFLGAVANAGPLISAFDILLLSSQTEGTPMVVLEAAAAGIPVVSTAVGGVPDLLGAGAGWLAPSGDAVALAAAVSEALRDGAEGKSRAKALLERFGADADGKDWVDRYLELYRRLIDSRSVINRA